MSSAHLSDSPSADELKARARALVGDLKRLAPEAEKLRRLPKESVELVRGAGLFRTIQPKSCGGYAVSMRAHVDVVSTIGEGCSAMGWVLGVCQAHSWMLGHFPRAAQEEVYGKDPDTIVSAVIGPRGRAVKQIDGSYVVNGVWPFGSGCEHSQWLLLGSEVHDAAGGLIDEVDLLIPTHEIEVRDDWHVAGLQGTGSNTLVAKEVRVPAHRALSLPPWLEGQSPSFEVDDAVWLTRAQAIPVLGLCISTAALGIARDALAEFRRIVPGKKIVYTGHVSDEWIPTQTNLGHAAAMIHAAELVLYRAADDIDAEARAGRRMSAQMRARIRMDCSYAVRTLMEAVDKLFIHSGATGLSLKGSIQRAARDLHAINMHALLLFETSAEIYGRVLLGKESNSPIY
jgi:3-hydroxy-9,10-secoandrosta-1,3,5(10)-triene-9,17-dione monooxygenase